MLRIERAIAERDYDGFARLLNAADGTAYTGNSILEWDMSNKHVGNYCERYAAFSESQLLGYGGIHHSSSDDAGRFQLWVNIDKAYRNCGFGQTFYDFLVEAATKAGADMLLGSCSEALPESLRFAEKQGFESYALIVDSEMDLEAFDASQWQDSLKKVEAQGIRFSSLAHEGFTYEAQYKLYRLNVETANDNPSNDGSWNPSFEQFKAMIYDAKWFDPTTQLLAIDGERFVGLSAVGFGDDETAFTAFTGVDKDYRGRGIAQALKVLASQFAKSRGAKRLPTSNDSRNAAMLAINKKLGYQRKKGTYLLKKRV